MNQPLIQQTDIVIIGGGQSGLAVAYFLRRTGRSDAGTYSVRLTE